jgi:CDP-diacylglycerol--glycerol-3-phosphate 3-phosphatidyltransferase
MPPIFWPITLTVVRLLLGPAMVALAWSDPGTGPWLVGGLVVGTATDILDGIVARHLGVATPRLRRADSLTDLVFWVCVLACACILRPERMRADAAYFAIMLGLEAATYALSFLRFGREHSTHAYSAKAWGLVLLGAFASILGTGGGRWTVPLLFGTYLVSWADVVAIILILPRWQSDVPSAYHAWLIRRGVPYRTFKMFH